MFGYKESIHEDKDLQHNILEYSVNVGYISMMLKLDEKDILKELDNISIHYLLMQELRKKFNIE
jgi:hypothetical protein